MTQIQSNKPAQPQDVAAESRSETREAGENAAREFSQAMKKDGRSGKEQAAPQTPPGTASSDASGTAASGAAVDAFAGIGGRESRLPGERPEEGFPTPQKEAGTGREPGAVSRGRAGEGANPSGFETAGAHDGALPASAFSVNRGGLKKDAASGGEQRAPGEEGALPRGDAILAGMAQQPGASAQAGGLASGPSAVEPSRLDADVTAKLVDRILVSSADAAGGAEVRISLREDVLPGTEIRILRRPDGGVSVQFVTGDARAEQMLGSRQLGDLQNVLSQSLQVEVRVATVRTDGSMSAEAGSGGRQGEGRGGQGGGQDGQPRDGRSRQHDIFDNLGDERA